MGHRKNPVSILSKVTDVLPATSTETVLTWYESWWVFMSLVSTLHCLQSFLRRRVRGALEESNSSRTSQGGIRSLSSSCSSISGSW